MPQAEGGAAPTGEPRPHHPQQHDHDGEGARRRRRGRRGGRRRGRRDGEPPQPHAAGPQDPFVDPRYPDAAAPPREDEAATAPIPPAAPALREPPPPRRIEGPGDAYDWPWNRRAERFPDEVAREAEIAREAEVAREAEAAQPFEAPAPAESAPMSSAPRVAELPREPESAPLPPRERPVAEDIAPPVEETPAGPPRKGWWRRLTQ
jgi:ribonuclease E